MSKHAQSTPGETAPATAAGETFGSVWRKHCAKSNFGHSDMSPLRRALNNAAARLKYRHVRHIKFNQLSWAGYDVQKFPDVAAAAEPEMATRWNLPEQWKMQKKVFVPRIVKLRDAVLFGNGAALLPDKRFFIGSAEAGMPPELGSRVKAFVYSDRREDSALIQRHMRCMDLPGRCFTARSRVFWNFGHFVHDILSRIYYEDLGAIVPGRDRVIAPPMPWPMQKTLFHKVFEGYEIVQAPLDVPLRVEELLFPAKLCSAKAGCNPAAIGSLARRMRRIVSPYAGRDGRKVCVSRRGGGSFHSEEEAFRNYANIEAYETRMREMGYDVVDVSAMEPEKQFSLWANTTDMVGIHGAGMLNMIMMPPGGNYTEIGATINRSCTVRCAMAAGHRVGVLESGARDPRGRQMIDLDRLGTLLIDAR